MELPQFRRRGFLRLARAAAALPFARRIAAAQAYPNRALRWIIGFPAGGASDVLARIMAHWLSARLGQPVIIENRPGAGTNIAVQAAAGAAPDGHTLLFLTATNAVNASLYDALAFNVLRDIAPVAGFADPPLVLEVGASVPIRTLAAFIAAAVADPGRINIASSGIGTIGHMAIELLRIATGIDVVHVPYRGGAPLIADLVGGQIQAGINSLSGSLPLIRQGALRALAVAGTARSFALPGIPTMGEVVPGYAVNGWTGVGVPNGTPAEIIARLNREINAGLADPEVRARLADFGAAPLIMSPEAFGALMAADTEKWAKVMKLAKMTPR